MSDTGISWKEKVADVRSKGVLGMQLYVVLTTPAGDMDAVLAQMGPHLAHQKKLEEQGVMFAAGPFADDDDGNVFEELATNLPEDDDDQGEDDSDEQEEVVVAEEEPEPEPDTYGFYIQLSVSSQVKALDETPFDAVSPVVVKQDGRLYRYLHGPFTQWDVALAAQADVRSKGFPDAFVVSYLGDQRVSNDEAQSALN